MVHELARRAGERVHARVALLRRQGGNGVTVSTPQGNGNGRPTPGGNGNGAPEASASRKAVSSG